MNKYRKALNHIILCDREDCGVSNLSDAYRNDIDALLELIRRYEDGELIEWHPYPKKKPKKSEKTWYLVTLKNGSVDMVPWDKSDAYGWDASAGYEFKYGLNDNVIAWAELPKPYGGE